MYKPVHGFAGAGKANPIALIASFAMCLRYSFNLVGEAALLESALSAALNEDVRTADIMSDGCKEVSTEEMRYMILSVLDRNGYVRKHTPLVTLQFLIHPHPFTQWLVCKT